MIAAGEKSRPTTFAPCCASFKAEMALKVEDMLALDRPELRLFDRIETAAPGAQARQVVATGPRCNATNSSQWARLAARHAGSVTRRSLNFAAMHALRRPLANRRVSKRMLAIATAGAARVCR
jgi:hypothetical protein